MGFLYYVAVQGIFDNASGKARLDRSAGALCYPSVARAGAEKHLATLLKDRNFTKVGPIAPSVIEVKVPGSTGPKVGAVEIAAMFSAKGQAVVGNAKLPAKVASAIAKGIADQGKGKPDPTPAKGKGKGTGTTDRKQAKQVEPVAVDAAKVEPVTNLAGVAAALDAAGIIDPCAEDIAMENAAGVNG